VLNLWSWRGPVPEARAILQAIPREHEWSPWMWFWLEVFDGRFQEAREALQMSSGEWIELKMWIRPKALMRGQAWTYQGEPKRARAEFELAAHLLEEAVAREPDEPRYRSSLGIAYAALGRTAEAVREGRRATELFPLSQDAVYALPHAIDLAHIYALVGQADRSLDELEYLLSIPGWLSGSWLATDPRWAPLRDSPRFQKLVGDRRVASDSAY